MMRHTQPRFLHEPGGGDWHLPGQSDYLAFLIRVDAPAIYLRLWQATLYVLTAGMKEAWPLRSGDRYRQNTIDGLVPHYGLLPVHEAAA
jgi:hypothetical protein